MPMAAGEVRLFWNAASLAHAPLALEWLRQVRA